MSEQLRLYSYWRSSAAYRVRIGLNIKQLAHEILPGETRECRLFRSQDGREAIGRVPGLACELVRDRPFERFASAPLRDHREQHAR